MPHREQLAAEPHERMPDLGLRPSARARAADEVTQAVLSGAVDTDRLCALVHEARLSAGAGYAQVSILSDRQVTLVADEEGGHTEVDSTRTAASTLPFEDTICVLALRSNDALRIDELTEDARTASVPAVAGGMATSYLGMPIRHAPHGMIGVLCVFNGVWTTEHATTLAGFAAEIGDELGRIRDSLERLPA